MEHAMPYFPAIIQAVEENGARVRILIYYDDIQRLENEVAVRVMERELEQRGLSDLVEVRYYNDGDMHSKAFSIDDKFVVIGSQNFHYSAWADGTGLTEYNLGTNDPGTIADFQDIFEYHWQRAIPRELSSPTRAPPDAR
jgi:phosphatidylserine/phosphatidylglycerophosphate/cardiolipin synthase-like enzyme